MAKMTIEGVTYEGTPAELAEMVREFTKVQAEVSEDKTQEDASKPQYKTEKRHAKVGERILIVRAESASGKYENGDVLTVVKDYGKSGSRDLVQAEGVSIGIFDGEYEVIIEEKDTKPAPAQTIEHKGATYELVTRKAQPGDVVVFTESKRPWFSNEIPYGPVKDSGEIVDNDGDIYYVYNELAGRTEANTLVYATKEKPLKVGDYVKPLPSANRYGVTNGEMKLGKVVRVDGSNIWDIRIEIVAHSYGSEIGERYSVNSKHFRKATDEEIAQTQPAKPKTGDIVVITANTNGSHNKVGDIGKVGVEIGGGGTSVRVEVVGGSNYANFTRYTEMRHATPAEVAEYHKAADIAALKEGDFITIDTAEYSDDITEGKAYEVFKYADGDLYFVDNDGFTRFAPISAGAFAKVDAPKAKARKWSEGDYAKTLKSGEFGDIKAGVIVEVGDVKCGSSRDPYEICAEPIDGGEHDYFRPQDLELVDAETAQKTVVLAKIGRKPNEFKKGDIARVINPKSASGRKVGDYVVVQKPDGTNEPLVEYSDGAIYYAEVELIAPVESRVDAK